MGRVHDSQIRIVQLVDLAGREQVPKSDDGVCALRFGDRRDDDTREFAVRAVLKIGVDREHNAVVLLLGEFLQPLRVSSPIIGEINLNPPAGGEHPHLGRCDKPVAEVTVAGDADHLRGDGRIGRCPLLLLKQYGPDEKYRHHDQSYDNEDQ